MNPLYEKDKMGMLHFLLFDAIIFISSFLYYL